MTGPLYAGLAAELEGEGIPVVFVHGLGGSSNTFQPIIGALRDCRVFRPDLPGSARSALPVAKLTLDSLIQAVLAAVKAAGLGRAWFVGHSLGTLICQHIAAIEPAAVRGLVLYGAIAEPPEAARQRFYERANAVRTHGMVSVADGIVAAALPETTRWDNPVAAAFVRESIMRQPAEGYSQTCEALAGATAAEHRLIRCPALLVTGEEDAIAPPSAAQTLTDRIAGSKVKLLDRCGHWPTVEKPHESGRLLAQFLAENRRA